MISRRRWLASLGIAGAGVLGLTAYSYQRGVRIPPVRWEPRALSSNLTVEQLSLDLQDVIAVGNTDTREFNLSLRAYAPEPAITVRSEIEQRISVLLNNIAPDAELLIEGQARVEEQQHGINRLMQVDLPANQPVTLNWQLPEALSDYRFASIGDSGGAHELAWCLDRAHQLGARFFVHLGDFHYAPGEYQTAIQLFRDAPLPCYVCIGNHDYHDGGLLYADFLHEIGPFNHAFAIGQTRFVNFDTASDIWPAWGGQRGTFLSGLAADSQRFAETIAFTHRPLFDPLPDSHHDLGQGAEQQWIIESLKRANISTMLSGHIHIYARETIEGIDNIIVGQGLGHQDMLTADINWSKMAIGNVAADGRVNFEFAPLAMPMALHCSPRSEPVRASLRNSDKAELIRQIDEACAAAGAPQDVLT